MIDRSFGSIYFLPCSNSLLGIATSHIGLIRSLYCSVFKEPSLFKRLDYLTTFKEACQMIFLKSFSSLFRTGPLHQRRVLSYHTAFFVSTAFFMFFWYGLELVRRVIMVSMAQRFPRFSDKRFPVFRSSHIHRFTANEKDFSLCSKWRCGARLHETERHYGWLCSWGSDGFPVFRSPHIHRFTANRKDFSLCHRDEPIYMLFI